MQSTGTACFQKDIFISKTLSWLLRHGALKQGLKLPPDGFIAVNDVLNSGSLKGKCTEEDIKRIVANNDKQRFTLRTSNSGVLEIRANQGHSIVGVDNLELTPITDPNQFENVIHGTYIKCWRFIKKEGLSRRNRIHIHFASGLPDSRSVISGMRKTAEVYIYINLRKALTSGLLFFLSSNKVILSPGNDEGYIKPEFFLKVVRAIDNSTLEF